MKRREPRRGPIVPFVNDIHSGLEMIDGEQNFSTQFNGGSSKRSGLKLAMWTWLSAFIDGLVLISISCFFAVTFSFLMKTSPGSVISLFLKNQNLMSVIGFLLMITIWAYLIFMRAFMGASIGEWACDLRLGQPLQRFKISYLFKVILRTTIIVVSGIIFIPILSLILSRDLAGDICGLRIYSLE
ncbi:MAG: RDD family protein [Bdellovibrionaceae bacterium]|nr:RDD family protein [Pseudobdellovibrionaceae bacterium]